MENEAVVPAPAEAAGDDVAVERPMKGDDDGGMVEESTEADTGAAVDGSKDASEEGGTAQSDPQQAPQRQESSSGSGGGSAPQPTGSVGPSPLTTPFVAPSSYLRPLSSRPGTGGAGGQSGDLSRGQETPPPPPSRSGGVGMRKASLPIDREQMEGLVSRKWLRWSGWEDGRADSVVAEGHPRLPQSPHELRRPASKLPPHRLRYCLVGEEESEYPHPMW